MEKLKPKANVYYRIDYLLEFCPEFVAELEKYMRIFKRTYKSKPKAFFKKYAKALNAKYLISTSDKELAHAIETLHMMIIGLVAIRSSFLIKPWNESKALSYSPSIQLTFNKEESCLELKLLAPISKKDYGKLWENMSFLMTNFFQDNKDPFEMSKKERAAYLAKSIKNGSKGLLDGDVFIRKSSSTNIHEDLRLYRIYLKNNKNLKKAEKAYFKFKMSRYLEKHGRQETLPNTFELEKDAKQILGEDLSTREIQKLLKIPLRFRIKDEIDRIRRNRYSLHTKFDKHFIKQLKEADLK